MIEVQEDIKAVLFDYDDTLINSSMTLQTAHREVAKSMLEHLSLRGYDEDEGRLLQVMEEVEEETETTLQLNRNLRWLRVLQGLGAEDDVPEKLLRRWTHIYWRSYAKGELYEDAIQTLEYLRRYSLGIITNTDGTPGIKRWRLNRSNLTSYFSIIIIAGEDEIETKPSPQPFLLAASKMQLAPNRCLMVGDKPYTDIQGAKQAGMKAALLLRRKWDDYANADYVLRELSELRSVL